ncbi:hypothetical protein SASPL_136501 [Salvia splendens]|uniref:Pectin acetylesterase n=1 Tax=Salvia splendens TaxID=180675 RepID=A0A8X8X1T9_SALSN|nr:hypothetical protein SASPL_136501 [Salvia splendens]
MSTRGMSNIFTSVIEELMSTQGMSNAENALLIGNSAGGLATILNCDRFHSFLPGACRVKCISDSGFFIRAEHLRGAQDNAIANFRKVVLFHELAQFLPESCTQRLAPELCFFPENVVNDIRTPLFLLNSDFDKYQTIQQALGDFVLTEGYDYQHPECYKVLPSDCLDTFYHEMCKDTFDAVDVADKCCGFFIETLNHDCFFYGLIKQFESMHLCDDKLGSSRAQIIWNKCYSGYT